MIFKNYILPVTILAVSYTSSWSLFASEIAPIFIEPAIAYQPRKFSPIKESSILTRKQIIEDLRLLKSYGFRSLVTYSAIDNFKLIPMIAREVGFNGTIIMGVWDPFSQREIQNAIDQSKYVNGYCIGNEGLGIRYSTEDLGYAMAKVKRLTNLPVTTSEPIDSYLDGSYRQWLLTQSDWLFPLAHPFWAKQTEPNRAVSWIMTRYDYLVATSRNLVILKEVGYPSAGDISTDETFQLSFFTKLSDTKIPFFYFEAFDQPWKRNTLKNDEVEGHWGVFQADGSEKKVTPWLKSLWIK